MTITREQVKDLQPGDVVELRDPSFPEVVLRGPVRVSGDDLMVSTFAILRQFGGVPFSAPWDLTVVSRAPRPLYVNHPRPEPVPGDVVSRGDTDGATWSWCRLRSGAHRWRNTANDEWYAAEDFLDFGNGLRLLVDGETGRVVQ